MKQKNIMKYRLATVAQCAAKTGLGFDEMMLGVVPTSAHASLYSSYLLLRVEGWASLQNRIVGDIRSSLDLGAAQQAADLLIVLRWFVAEHYPKAEASAPDTPVEPVHIEPPQGVGSRTDALS